MKQGIYKFEVDCGRMGSLESVFVEYDTVVAAAIGCHADFGEVLGKHSNVGGALEPHEIKLLTEDPAFVALFVEHIGSTGNNPISALTDNELGSDEFWAAHAAAYPKA